MAGFILCNIKQCNDGGKLKTILMTLLYVVNGNKVLLAEKKRGFGSGLYNGAGGKVDAGETVEQAMIRETQEEWGITPVKYEQVALNSFEVMHKGERSLAVVHIFIATEYIGQPQETDEMKPVWFDTNEIPYDRMWASDPFWLPRVLKGEKVKGNYVFDDKNKVVSHVIEGLSL